MWGYGLFKYSDGNALWLKTQLQRQGQNNRGHSHSMFFTKNGQS
jgi:hypothetical protein